MYKVTWMAEDGEVSYTECESSPPEVGDVEEFDITVASFRQVVKVVDEDGTVPGAPDPTPPSAPVVDDPELPAADPTVEAQGDVPEPFLGMPGAAPVGPPAPEPIPVAGPSNPAGQ